jgi:hypothetical protein
MVDPDFEEHFVILSRVILRKLVLNSADDSRNEGAARL